MRTTLLVVLLLAARPRAHREHKVHNIVLYPDKQSWCKTTPIKQVVGEPGYESTTVENSVCVGTCFSYSIPHTSDITITPYCDSCQPSTTHWFHVTLHKLENAEEELSEYPNQDVSTPLPDTIKKQIQIITNCTCLSCLEQLTPQRHLHVNTTELPKSLLASSKGPRVKVWEPEDPDDAGRTTPFEIPELLQLVNRTKKGSKVEDVESGSNDSDARRYYLNTKLINLLKSIQSSEDSTPTENTLNFDKDLLSELLQIIEGSENHLNDKNLMDFVNFVNIHNSDDFELDLSRLKTVLTQYEDERLRDKHRQFGLGTVEYATLRKEHRRHFVGEHVDLRLEDGVSHGGHLVRGPHDSLVVQPDGAEQKIDLEATQLRPNHEGTVVHYQTHEQHVDDD